MNNLVRGPIKSAWSVALTVLCLVTCISVTSGAEAQVVKLVNRYLGALRGGVVSDSWGTKSSQTTFSAGKLYIQIPPGSTIEKAYLVSAFRTNAASIPAGTEQRKVILGAGATAKDYPLEGALSSFLSPYFGSKLQDATETINALLPTANADGLIEVPIQERGDQSSTRNLLPIVLGHTLVVIYKNTAAPLRNVAVFLGAGGTSGISDPGGLSNTNLTFDFTNSVASLGCANQEPFPASTTILYQVATSDAEQNGVIKLNNFTLSNKAGWNDDSDNPLDTLYMSLITGGSFGAGPASSGKPVGYPTSLDAKGDLFSGAGNGRQDDELYDFTPAISDAAKHVVMTYAQHSYSFLSTFVFQTLARVNDTDADGDGAADNDAAEGCADADNDGIPNYLDADSPNVAPVAVADTLRIVAGTTTNFATSVLLANDSDSDNNPISVLSVSNPSVGSNVTLNGTTVTLTLPASGTSSTFNYTIKDSFNAQASAQVNIDFLNVGVNSPTENAALGIRTPTISGTTLPNQALTVVLSSISGIVLTQSITSDDAGNWLLVVPAVNALVDGMYTATVSATDAFAHTVSVDRHFTVAFTNTGDGDGIPDVNDADDDNDGIPDSEEKPGDVARDTDGDGIPNHLDLDSDNDGIPDTVEVGLSQYDANFDGRVDVLIDADGDGWDDRIDNTQGGIWSINVLIQSDADNIADYLDLDSDADGITDNVEAGLLAQDVDRDGRVDNVGVVGMDTDDNDDGWHDSASALADVANLPNSDDTDQNELGNLPDYRDTDSDNDNVPDATEGHDANHDGVADVVAASQDTDGDGLDNAFDPTNGVAVTVGIPATLPDTDIDGTRDYRDADDDADVILSAYEDANRNATGDPRAVDTDGDGRPNYLDSDDDGDGSLTASEMPDPNSDGKPTDAINSNHNDNPDLPDYLDASVAPADGDADGLSDVLEAQLGTSTTSADTDNDGVCDGSTSVPGTCVAGENAQTGLDTDGDGVIDARDIDDDNDTLSTRTEDVNKDGNPVNDDTDKDGIANFRDTDDDGDGIPTAIEVADAKKNGSDDTDGDGIPNWLDSDSNNDGIADGQQANLDANQNGIPDYVEPVGAGVSGGAAIDCSAHEGPAGAGTWLSVIAIAAALLLGRRRRLV